MGILSDVLQYKARKDAEREQQSNAIPQALMAYQQAKQQSQDNMLKQLTVQATLAKSGLGIGPNGKLIRDTSLQDPTSLLDTQLKQAQLNNINDPTNTLLKQARINSLNATTAQKTGSSVLGNYDAKTPEEFLESIPQDKQINVKGIADYSLDATKLASLRNNERDKYFAAAGKYAELSGKKFDANEYALKYQTKKDFTTGKFGQAINASNTVLGHLDTLKSKLDALNNVQLDGMLSPLTKTFNRGKNLLAGESGESAIAGVKPTIEAVSSEMMKVYRNVGAGSTKEIDAWKDAYDPNSSPKQQAEYLKTGAELLTSKIEAMGENYKNGMGSMDGFPGVSERGLKTLRDLGVSTDSFSGSDSSEIKSFDSVESALKANLPKGTVVSVGGKKGRIN